MKYLVHVILLFLIIFTVAGCSKEKGPRAQNGHLDLQGYDLELSGPAGLDGEWEFYRGRLLYPDEFTQGKRVKDKEYILVPNVWDGGEVNQKTLLRRGYATYRLVIELPGIEKPLALKIANVASAYRLWLNGNLISTCGIVGKNVKEEVPKHSLSIATFKASNRRVELILQVSNHHHITGGVRSSPVIGSADELNRRQAVSWAMSMFLAGILLIFGVYHLLLYLLRPKDTPLLWFGLFCMLLGGSTTLAPSGWFIDQLFKGLSWSFLFKFNLFLLFIEVPCIVYFVYSLFPEEGNRVIMKALAYISVGFIGIAWFLSAYQATWLLAVYQPITLLCIGVGLTILYRAFRSSRHGAATLLAGFLLFAFTGVHDILYDKRIINSVYLLPFGLLLFVVSQSLVLAKRFTNAFSRVEILSVDLEQKNLQLEEMGRQKDRFIANTSHELKTPLHGIIGIIDSLLSGGGGSLAKKVVQNLTIVSSSARRLNCLVDDLLDMTLLEKKSLKLRFAPVDLRTLSDTVVTVLSPMSDRKKLLITINLANDLPLVWADENRLQQILFNLVGNALKFTDQGRINISANPVKEMVEVSVTDTGIGIAKDKYRLIFESFSRVEEGHRKIEGTGLGLNITQQLVELHGGKIRVDSTVGEGSVFTFSIPVVSEGAEQFLEQYSSPGEPCIRLPVNRPPLQQDDGAARLPETISAKPGQPRVLVVDDEPVNLQVAANVLTMNELGFALATSGLQALELLAAGERFDIILLDIMMPGLSGFEVCRRLRETFSASQLPVIIITARNRVSDLVEGLDSGANDYLTKPFSNEELIARVKTQLDLKKAYKTLEENITLKRELAKRAKTEFELRMMQRRLSNMLDAAPDPLLAINESDEIAFSNRQFQECTGYKGEELLGHPAATVVGDGPWRSGEEMPNAKQNETGHARYLEIVEFIKKDQTTLSAAAMLTHIEIDDSLLKMVVLRQNFDANHGFANGARPGGLSTLTLIEELARNRKRVRDLEASLNGSWPLIVAQSPDFTQTIQSIDSALGQMEQLLGQGDEQLDKRKLAVEVMRLSIEYWQGVTGKTKGDLARESTIWKVYTNLDGWDRTQTLDKYLDIKTIPKRPRLAQVLETGDFALAVSDITNGVRQELENLLARLRLIV